MDLINILKDAYLRLEPLLFYALNPMLSSKRGRIGRCILMQKYARGTGLEIGAFASPVLVPIGVKVKYVDRVDASHWRDHPEYKNLKIVEPDIMDDGALLASVPKESVDFIVSFHVLEHIPNPLEAVKNWIRVMRKNGILIVSVPDKHSTFDKCRSVTDFEHLVRDFEEGPVWSSKVHYRDVAINTNKLTGDEIENFIKEAPPAIHFHVWDFSSFFQFWQRVNTYFEQPFEILQVVSNHNEVIAVMRRK